MPVSDSHHTKFKVTDSDIPERAAFELEPPSQKFLWRNYRNITLTYLQPLIPPPSPPKLHVNVWLAHENRKS